MHKLFFHVGSRWSVKGKELKITRQFRGRFNPPDVIVGKDEHGDEMVFKNVESIDGEYLGGDHQGYWAGDQFGELLCGSNTKTEVIRRLFMSGCDFAHQIDMIGGRETIISIKDQYGDFLEAITGSRIYHTIPLKIRDIDLAVQRWREGATILLPKSDTTLDAIFVDDHDMVLRLLSGKSNDLHPHYIKGRGSVCA